jgi:cation:H+ antiporter
MSLLTIATLIGGLVLLTVGGEALVRGSSRLALLVGMSPLIVGLTVVAFGTSAPELAVSVRAGMAGTADIAIGNVVGSNIFNILAILGVCALFAPLVVDRGLLRRDVPVMVAASLLLPLLAFNGRLSQVEGVVLFVLLLLYLVRAITETRGVPHHPEGEERPPRDVTGIIKSSAMVLVGLVTLVYGADLLVDSAVTIATAMGVSQAVIGLTIVAAGTSLPEVAASVVATIRGQRDIAIGNVIGSSIFNVLCILGIASAVTGGGLPVSAPMLAVDIPVMVIVSVACLLVVYTGRQVTRGEGVVFLGAYLAYTAYLVLNATSHPAAGPFVTGALYVALPVAAIYLLLPLRNEFRRPPVRPASR